MKAKKIVETKKEGEYEIKKFHVIEIKENINIEEIADRLGLFDEDGETAYFSYGLCFGMDGEIFCIEPNKFVKGVTEKLNDNENEEYWNIEEEDQKRFEEDLKKLEKYKGYDIYL